MSRKTARNSDILKTAKDNSSPKIYALVLELANEGREDLVDTVLKIDTLLEYTSMCIKQRDYWEAKEGLGKAKSRIDMLKEQGVDTEYLDHLYEGIAKKVKSK